MRDPPDAAQMPLRRRAERHFGHALAAVSCVAMATCWHRAGNVLAPCWHRVVTVLAPRRKRVGHRVLPCCAAHHVSVKKPAESAPQIPPFILCLLHTFHLHVSHAHIPVAVSLARSSAGFFAAFLPYDGIDSPGFPKRPRGDSASVPRGTYAPKFPQQDRFAVRDSGTPWRGKQKERFAAHATVKLNFNAPKAIQFETVIPVPWNSIPFHGFPTPWSHVPDTTALRLHVHDTTAPRYHCSSVPRLPDTAASRRSCNRKFVFQRTDARKIQFSRLNSQKTEWHRQASVRNQPFTHRSRAPWKNRAARGLRGLLYRRGNRFRLPPRFLDGSFGGFWRFTAITYNLITLLRHPYPHLIEIA